MMQEARSRLRVSNAYGRRPSHRWIGESGSVPQRMATKILFERPNGAFGGVPSVDMGWHELVVNVVVVEVGPEGSRCFVGKALE